MEQLEHLLLFYPVVFQIKKYTELRALPHFTMVSLYSHFFNLFMYVHGYQGKNKKLNLFIFVIGILYIETIG